MAKIDKRFTILFSEEEILLLKEQARARGLSSGELVRKAVQNEITKKSSYDKINALHRIHQIFANKIGVAN
ncbi:MAG: ribbon-helix-helix protein, CopG family [Leptospira sp.]|nr:ribbon-helix-helix protein, CopG family [Leptospira sp.]